MSLNRPWIITIALLCAARPLMGMASPLPWARGERLEQTGRYADAVQLLAPYARWHPEAAYWLAEARHHLGDDAGAITLWKTVERHGAFRLASRARLSGLRDEGLALEDALSTYRKLLLADADPLAWRGLADRLSALVARDPDGQDARRARLVLADCLARGGETDRAADTYRSELVAYPAHADLCLYRLSQLAGPPTDSGIRLALQLADDYPSSPLAAPALLQAGRALTKAAPVRSEALFQRVIARYPNDPASEEAVYLLATAIPGDRLEALRTYRARYPRGPHGLEVAQALSRHPRLSTLPAPERLDLGDELLDDGADEDAIRVLRPVAHTGLELYHLGRAYWGDGDRDQARATLARAEAIDTTLRARILLTLGQMDEEQHRYDDAEADYRAAARTSGNTGLEGLTLLSAFYRRHDDDASAHEVDGELIARYPWTDEASTALWRFFFKDYRDHDYSAARAVAMRLIRNRGPEGTRGLYWLARLDHEERHEKSALSLWRRVVARDPLSYYGWRARFRLAAAQGGTDPGFAVSAAPLHLRLLTPSWSSLLPAPEARLLDGDTHRQPTAYLADMMRWPAAVRELVYLGQYDAVARYCVATHAPSRLRAWIALQRGHYERAIHLGDGDPLLTYPLGFWEQTSRAAAPESLDPLLLISLVRQESLFDPKSLSWVGAVGLAQLMPDTARIIASHLDVPPRPLTDPAYNLLLGAHYLAATEKLFGNRAFLAVAAYNAGDAAVSSWVQRFPTGDPEVFVESIPYPETRDYVKQVFSNYWNYRFLYGS